MAQNLVPLCSYQYDRTFNTTRIPGIQTDKIVHFSDSTHIAVYHAGRFFKMPCYYKGRLLNPKELQIQFERILADESVPEKGEANLGALTAGERKPWAEARTKFFSKGINRLSLAAIEKAAFVVVLEEEEYDYCENKASQLDRFGRAMLHGKGYDRWYDKSFNVIIMKNGRKLPEGKQIDYETEAQKRNALFMCVLKNAAAGDDPEVAARKAREMYQEEQARKAS